MKTSKTFKILLWRNTTKRMNNLAPIYARITVNGKRAEISLGTIICYFQFIKIYDNK